MWFLGRLICRSSHPLSSKRFVTFILFRKTVCLPGITVGNKRKVRAHHTAWKETELLYNTTGAMVKINSRDGSPDSCRRVEEGCLEEEALERDPCLLGGTATSGKCSLGKPIIQDRAHSLLTNQPPLLCCDFYLP